MDLSRREFQTPLIVHQNYTLEAGLILQKLQNTLSNSLDCQMTNSNNNNTINNNNIELKNKNQMKQDYNQNIIQQQQQQQFYQQNNPLSKIIIPDAGKTWIETVIEMEMRNQEVQYQNEESTFVEKMLLEQPPTISTRRNPRETEIKDPLQQQKAESCRRSRLNGKIKKAKTRFRHKFVSEKLSKSSNLLKCIHEVIDLAEIKLIQGGFDKKALDELKRGLGMNRNIDDLLNIEPIIDYQDKQQQKNNNSTTKRCRTYSENSVNVDDLPNKKPKLNLTKKINNY